ncbi:hypothetical protein [Helicobacter cinaedi]|uniref:hypothetical protein n=1 Tax=Helicobacter cinaedi TaxID=213 RepID=UPI001E5444F8|nr:hypothetical protein [Helicobacter cinaedi]
MLNSLIMAKKTEPVPADLAYVESLLTPEFFAKVKDAMMTGDLSNVWHLFDWSKLNYDYQGKPYTSEGFIQPLNSLL